MSARAQSFRRVRERPNPGPIHELDVPEIDLEVGCAAGDPIGERAFEPAVVGGSDRAHRVKPMGIGRGGSGSHRARWYPDRAALTAFPFLRAG